MRSAATRSEGTSMALKITSLCMLLSIFSRIGASQGAPPFEFSFTQAFGPYQVGFRVVQQYDLSRPFGNGTEKQATTSSSGRPIQTLIWYPSGSHNAPPITVGDFEALISHETSFGEPLLHGPSQDFAHTYMRGTETTPTVSFRDARPEGHRFPVVVYAPSLNAPSFENIELCEYLASYGYVVLASPSLGPSIRNMTVDSAGTSAQTADILYLLRFAKTLKDVDAQTAAVVGYSWGGTAALLSAAKDPHIKALIALDGSFRYGPVPSVDYPSIAVPLLFFSRGETPIANLATNDPTQKANSRFLIAWTHGDLLQVRLLAISHIQFSSLYQRSERFKHEGMQFVPAGYSLRDGNETYGWIARYTMEFLQAYLKRDGAAHAYIARSPAENGVPSQLVASEFRTAALR